MAEIVVVPAVNMFARPAMLGILNVATKVFDEPQVTDFVKSTIELSVNNPAARNCCNVVAEIDTVGLAGNTVIDTSSAGVAVSVTLFDVTPENWAEMAVVPTALAVARPLEPAVLLIVATVVFDEIQLTSEVRS